ncbi:MFS transporter [Sphingomonas sp. DT-204]|uniref:MFS transporter n=1 Tax=Sphingomonas sp. DT-204 TaxID=3396166 RepID=UPI003F1964C0
MSTASTVESQRQFAPGAVSGYDWYVVAILFLVSVLGYIDRVILSFLIEPIKADLSLTDAELGAVTGMAFAVLYVFGGVLIGRMLDRGRRVTILAACILIWSVATAASGLAAGFLSLFAARMFVGVGEAGLNPAAIGIISSRFPQDQVQKPIGLFTTGLYVGGGLAMLVGARLLAQFSATGSYSFPLLGELEPWRAVFLLLAVPGLFIAVLVQLSVRDKRAAATVAVGAQKGEATAFMRSRAKLLMLLMGSVVAWSMNNYGLLNWYPAMLMRSYAMSPSMVATTYGPAFLFAGIAGCLAVYPYHSWLRSRFGGGKSAYYLCLSSMAVLSVTTIVGPLMPTVGLAILMAYVNMFVSSMSVASVFVLIVAAVPATLRGLYTGLYMALVNLTGGAFGSVLVGLLTDHVFGASGLNLALSSVAAVMGPLGALLMYLAAREAPEAA